MPCDVFPPLLLLLSLLGVSHACLQDPTAAYRFTGAVCRLTYPAAVVLNEKTTKVIEAAFQHARYPSMKGEKSIIFVGQVLYGLDNLEIHNLSIGKSEFQLRPGRGIDMKISNVSATFRGTLQYGYSNMLVNAASSVDFEIESQIDLGINPKLYCGDRKVEADTSDCYLNFHKLQLHLQGDKQPGWLKRLFTNFVTFTVRMAIRGQICKEINKAANIMADFIQEKAEQVLSDGSISVDISVTTTPSITADYIESYHKGLTIYRNTTAVINQSVFHPSQVSKASEDKMLYFWLSDDMFNSMLSAAHQDGRFQMNISGENLTELFKANLSTAMPELIEKCLLESESPELRVWSSDVPYMNTSTRGSTVRAEASGQLNCWTEGTVALFFQTSLTIDITTSYANKKLSLHGNTSEIFIVRADLPFKNETLTDEAQLEFIREAVEKIGTPKVLSVLEVELTRLLDRQGVNLFDIINPEVLSQDGYTVIQMDFGFPHHLLVEFLKKTLQ